jgi:hypothetical protein
MFYYYDYMFYRLAQWYRNFYSADTLPWQAVGLVSIAQSFIYSDIVFVCIFINYIKEERMYLLPKILIIIIIPIIGIGIFNLNRYYNKFIELENRWSNENINKTDKMDIIVFLMFIIPLIFLPVLLNIFDFTK